MTSCWAWAWASGPAWAASACARVDLGLVLRLHDGGLPGVLGLLALGDLLRLGGCLVGLRLGDLRLRAGSRRCAGRPSRRCSRGPCRRSTGSAASRRSGRSSPSRPSSRRAPRSASFCRSVTISSTVIEPMIERRWPAKIRPVRIDIWSWSDRNRCAGVDDALVVVADLERDDRADVQRDALPGDTGLGDLGLAHRQRQEADLAEERAARTRRGRSPPGTALPPVPSFPPEISMAWSGAGTR